MSLVDRTKKELVEIIHGLQEKLKEMKPVESALTAQLQDLHSNAVGLFKNEKGQYRLVKIKYNIERNAAAIESIDNINDTVDPALAQFKLTQYAHETILRKARGSKYDQK